MRFHFGLDPIEFAATERTYFWMERSVSSFWLEHPRRSAAFPQLTSADLLNARWFFCVDVWRGRCFD